MTQIVISIVAVIAAFGGVATGIVALRKVGTENIVAVRSIANTEADSTMEGLGKFNEVLRADNIAVHEQLRSERTDHEATRVLLRAALKEATR